MTSEKVRMLEGHVTRKADNKGQVMYEGAETERRGKRKETKGRRLYGKRRSVGEREGV